MSGHPTGFDVISALLLLRSLSKIGYAGLILGLRPANTRHCYKETPSLIGWTQPRISTDKSYLNDSPPANRLGLCRSLYWIIVTDFGCLSHDDVIKWKHFPRYWPFVRGIHRSPVVSPHKGQWHGALIFSLICAWTVGHTYKALAIWDAIVLIMTSLWCEHSEKWVLTFT